MFKLKDKQCHLVMVKVIRGTHITKGKFHDLIDKPDPYIRLHVPEAGSLHRSTKVIDNDCNPEWNETFQFILKPSTKHSLHLELWESNYVHDDLISKHVYDLDTVQLGVTTKDTVTFFGKTTVDLEITRTLSEQSDIRLGLTLCDEEKNFVNDRKQKVFKAMQEAFGAEGPQNLDEVPVIGVMGSGGGFRAMTSFCGVLSALSESGVFDMTTYLAGLSGSTWYMGHLYSHPDWPNKTPKQLQEVLKKNITQYWFKKIFSYSLIKRLQKLLQDKKKRTQPVSITDFYGMLVGEILLRGEMEGHLSDQTKKIEKADLPLPIYTAVRVKPNTSADKFCEWVEFSPYEISMPKYGVSLQPQLFNSKFHLGRLEEAFPEPNLHFLLGVFGSAYSILIKRVMGDGTETTTTKVEENKPSAVMDEDSDESDDEEEEEEEEEEKEEKEEGLKSLWLTELEHEALQRAQADAGEQSSGLGQTGLVMKTLKLLMGSKAFNSRQGRAAKVLNFCSGVDAPATHAFSPFSCADEMDVDACMDKKLSAKRSLYMVDAGLSTINLPTPTLLRPQRHIDLIISFDFTAREDGVCPLEQLRKSEVWAKEHGVPFPPISISRETVQKEGVKECYVFRHKEDDLCPIVVHFVLVNDTFKTFKSPGERRVTPEEKEFGEFSVFNDDEQPYRTMNFTYTDKSFERIVQLMSYNTLNHKKEIFDAIKECTSRRKQRARVTGVSWDVLRVVSQAAKNFSKLAKKPEVSAEGLKKVEDLITNTVRAKSTKFF